MSRKSPKKAVKKQARSTRSKSFRSMLGNNYARMAAGVAGLAITAYLVLSTLGGTRAVVSKARTLLNWKPKFGSLSSPDLDDLGNSGQRFDRGNSDVHAH